MIGPDKIWACVPINGRACGTIYGYNLGDFDPNEDVGDNDFDPCISVPYTRSDLCIPPSEAEALRAENIALLEALNKDAEKHSALAAFASEAMEVLELLAKSQSSVSPNLTRGVAARKARALLSKHTKGGE